MLPCYAMSTLQRAVWDGHPVSLGIGFELRKQKGRSRAARSLPSGEPFSWVATVFGNGRTAVSFARLRSSDEVLDVCEHWRAVMVESGWS